MFLRLKKLSPILIASTGIGAVALTNKTAEEKEKATEQNDSIATNYTNGAPQESNSSLSYEESSGWERVKTIFKMNQYGENSVDFAIMANGWLFGLFAGICVGAITKSKEAREAFLEQNDATKFQNVTEARRQLSRVLTKEMFNGVFQYGPKYSFIVGGTMSLSVMIAAYRGKSGFLEWVMAMGLTGALYRINYGLRGMIVGGTLGSVCGAMLGATVVPLAWIFGEDLEKSRKEFHDLYHFQERYLRKKGKELSMKNLHSEIEQEKYEKIKDVPVTLDSFDDSQKTTA